MNRTQKSWAAAGAALLVGAGALVWNRAGAIKRAWESAAPSHVSGWRDPASGQPGSGTGPSPPFAAPAPGDAVNKPQLDATMAAWRDGILNRDADTVTQLEQAFVDHPGVYGPALLTMAENEQNERVRAFCTRVLGRLDNVGLAEVFQRRLQDPSPFVRQNAAWALGELAAQPAGRQAAEMAVAELRQAEERDPASDVRVAAGRALAKLR